MKRWQTWLGVVVVAAAGSLQALAATYKVDPVHSSAIFRILHNKISYLYGRITAPEGTIVFDAAKPENATFNLTLKATNIDTANAQRDTHLKSPTFFNAAEFPTLTFKSTAVKKVDDKNLDVTGDLTIRGVKKSITVKMEITGQNAGAKPLIGFEATFTIKRSDFDMKEMPDMVGDDVRITVSFEAGA
jgi:polyisoprenoid-binding protein YceI